jgi:hypothetical protein
MGTDRARARWTHVSLVMAVITIVVCTSVRSDAGVVTTGASSPPACGTVSLQVGIDEVRGYLVAVVTNTSAAACSFTGQHPVTMNVWRLDGSEPPVATGVLGSQASYVQPYEARAANTCPLAGETSLGTRRGSVTVHVEGIAHSVLVTWRRAREITDCAVYRAVPPYIVG